MKEMNYRLVFRRSSLLIILLVVQSLIMNELAQGQGWGFTPTVSCSGNCYNYTLPLPVTTGFATQPECNAVRQMLIDIRSSVGGCECHITCSACTGADLPRSGDFGMPGSISNNGQVDGKPILTPHQSQAAQDFWNDYKQQLQSYGVKSIYGNQLYRKKTNEFDPPPEGPDTSGIPNPGPPKVKPNNIDNKNDITNKTVPLMGGSPLTFEEQQRLRLIQKFGPGYIDQANMFTNVENGAVEKKESHPYIEMGRQVAIVGAGFLEEKYVVPAIFTVDVVTETIIKPGTILYNNTFNGTNDVVPGTGEILVNTAQKLTEDLIGNSIGGAAEHDIKLLTSNTVQQEMISKGVLPGIAKISEKPGNIGEAVSKGYKYFSSGKDLYDGWGEMRKNTNQQ